MRRSAVYFHTIWVENSNNSERKRSEFYLVAEVWEEHLSSYLEKYMNMRLKILEAKKQQYSHSDITKPTSAFRLLMHNSKNLEQHAAVQ
jgi:hypothetical protein